jgi:hypothetical protein
MKENFTVNNKPAAKVLSNKKSRQRKKNCLAGQLANRTEELCCLSELLS